MFSDAAAALPRKQRKGKKGKPPKVDDWDANRTNADSETRAHVNQQFVRYYQSQLAPLLTGDDDWAALDAKLRLPLPITFRFSGSPGDAAPEVLARREYGDAVDLSPRPARAGRAASPSPPHFSSTCNAPEVHLGASIQRDTAQPALTACAAEGSVPRTL